MRKKGFTLIELLAVIVVLAIIALIATPMVLNTIESARKGAAKSSGYGYINGLETSLASYMLKNNGTSYSAGKYDISTLNTDLEVSIKGDKPTEGKVCISSNGDITKASLKISEYIVSYDGKEVKNTDLKEVEDITCDKGNGNDNDYLTYAQKFIDVIEQKISSNELQISIFTDDEIGGDSGLYFNLQDENIININTGCIEYDESTTTNPITGETVTITSCEEYSNAQIELNIDGSIPTKGYIAVNLAGKVVGGNLIYDDASVFVNNGELEVYNN